MSRSLPDSRVIILCESTDRGTDKKFLNRLINESNISYTEDSIYTLADTAKGKTGSVNDVIDYIKNGLPVLQNITQRKNEFVLVIIDADDNPNERFKEIISAFNPDIFAVPTHPGTLAAPQSDKIRTGIFLFPDNENAGSIETLLLQTLDKSKLNCSENYLNCVEKLEKTNMSQNNRSKSQFRVFMATPNPDRYIDNIIEQVDFTSQVFADLIFFLKLPLT